MGFVAEKKLSLTYSHITPVGVPMYIGHVLAYLALVEFGIYWVHRKLHTVKFLYNHVHLMHHKYNKPEEVR